MAAEYYGKAAQSNNAEGLYNLALLHMKGLGVKIDYKLAISLLKRASSQNHMRNIPGMSILNVGVAEAEHSLGLVYNEGRYVDKDTRIAAQWYEKAVKHNYSNSANNLGILYMNGEGVEQNLDKAEELFLLAHKLNNIDCMFNLIYLYLIKNDPERALMWHERALKSELAPIAQSRDKEIREMCIAKLKFKNVKENYSQNEEIEKVVDEFFTFKNKWSAKAISPQIPREKANKVKNLDYLIEYASNGSIMAQEMLESQFYFYSAINLIKKADFDKYEFVSLMSQCIKRESFSWSIDEAVREKSLLVIEEIISENKVNDTDRDARRKQRKRKQRK